MQSSEQNNNSNYQKMGDEDSTSWYLLSIISWILFGISMWVSYCNGIYFWSSFTSITSLEYYPLEIGDKFPYLYIYLSLLGVIGFITYLIFTTCKKRQDVYDGMLGNISKFHFVPLLLISSLYIVSISSSYISESNTTENYKSLRTLISFDLIFTIIGLISLIIIYLKTELNSEWYIVLAIKKGIYSSFIIILLYNFFHIIVTFKFINDNLDDKEFDSIRKFLKGSGIAFTCLFGIISLAFSFLFKDVMAGFTTFLTYLGMVITFFTKNEYEREERKENFNGVTDGVLDIIFMLLSLALIAYLVLKCRQNLF